MPALITYIIRWTCGKNHNLLNSLHSILHPELRMTLGFCIRKRCTILSNVSGLQTTILATSNASSRPLSSLATYSLPESTEGIDEDSIDLQQSEAPTDLSSYKSMGSKGNIQVPKMLQYRLCNYLAKFDNMKNHQLRREVANFRQYWPLRRMKSAADEIDGSHKYSSKFEKWDAQSTLLYALSEFEREYSIATNILKIIRKKDPNYMPKYTLDYKSKCGFNTWAVLDQWNGKDEPVQSILYENCVPFQKISHALIDSIEDFKSVFHKISMPNYSNPMHDLVISSNNLMTAKHRSNIISLVHKLWKLSSCYIILVEAWSAENSQAIIEARECFKKINEDSRSKMKAKFIAPCPHQQICPLYRLSLNEVCGSQVNFRTIDILREKMHPNQSTDYSYLIVKKVSKVQEESESKEISTYSRLIQKPFHHKKNGNINYRICTNDAFYVNQMLPKTLKSSKRLKKGNVITDEHFTIRSENKK